jgi:hypothetical protein
LIEEGPFKASFLYSEDVDNSCFAFIDFEMQLEQVNFMAYKIHFVPSLEVAASSSHDY